MLKAQFVTAIKVADLDGGDCIGLAIYNYNRIYAVINKGEANVGLVKVIEGSTNEISASIKVGKDPRLAAVDTARGRIYVTNRGDNSVSVVDVSMNEGEAPAVKLDTNELAQKGLAGTVPFGIAVDPILHRVYVANAGTSTISVLDDAPGSALPTVIASVGVGDAAHPADPPEENIAAYPYYLAVDPTNHHVYVANWGSDWGHTISVIDGLKNTLVTTVALGDPSKSPRPAPHGIDVNPSTKRIYVGNMGKPPISVVEEGTNPSAPDISVDGPCFAVRADPGTNRIWATTDHSVVLIDGETLTNQDPIVLRGTPHNVGQPHDVAVEFGSHRAYIACKGIAGTGNPGGVAVVELVESPG